MIRSPTGRDVIVFKGIQNSLEYIDTHLDDDLSLKDVADVSGISLSYFHRLILASTGFTVKEYIRNKRLSRAADQLVNTDRRILDIAMDARFNSHEVFTRAFSQLYGISPKDYRTSRKGISLFQKHELLGKELETRYRAAKDDIEIQAKVIERGVTTLVGIELRTSVKDTIERNVIPKFWSNQFVPRIGEIRSIQRPFASAAYEVHDPESDELYHMACVEVTERSAPIGMICQELAPAPFAVFSTHRALNPIEYCVLIQFIYGEWLPVSGLQTSSDFTIDVNLSDCYYSETYLTRAHNTDTRLEVYIPVK